jgi:hypothetical protein
MADVQGALLQWRTDETELGNYGEGVSRPRQNARVKDFTVLITLPQAKPIKWYTRAESKRAATKYARNRWPLAVAVEVL